MIDRDIIDLAREQAETVLDATVASHPDDVAKAQRVLDAIEGGYGDIPSVHEFALAVAKGCNWIQEQTYDEKPIAMGVYLVATALRAEAEKH
jgi:hypothetical protein